MLSINFLYLTFLSWFLDLVYEFEVLDVEAHRVEPEDNGDGEGPFQNLADH